MEAMRVTHSDLDFSAAHAAVHAAVEAEFLPCFSSAVLVGEDIVDTQCIGWADREARIPLRADHIFRVFSNTKLLTSCAALLLFEQGSFALDDPIEEYLPQLANRRVLRPGAQSLSETEPAQRSITVRQIMTHSAGLGSGVFDRESLLFDAYTERKIVDPMTSLAAMMDALSDVPLAYQPGTSWAYSVASDVLARLVEVVSGEAFDSFIKTRIFDALGMVDTGFAATDPGRLTTFYVGADPADPTKPGLSRADDRPYPGAFLRRFPRLNASMGLVSTLTDQVSLIKSLHAGERALLRPETLSMMMVNQLPEGMPISFPGFGVLEGKGFGLGGAVVFQPTAFEHPAAKGEVFWGGRGGTHWWISPGTNSSGVIMTQREMGHSSMYQYKGRTYQALTSR
jgi:CubicO group peptidase (beta-lactamase class C family)